MTNLITPRKSGYSAQRWTATPWLRNSLAAQQCLGEAAEAVDSTVSAAFFRGRPEQKPRAAL